MSSASSPRSSWRSSRPSLAGRDSRSGSQAPSGPIVARVIPRAPFGKTGHSSRRTLFGGAALGRVTDAEADRALELVLRYDLDHLDTAASYGDSELRIAPWLKREGRDRFFLATKTGKRTYPEARDET